MVLRAGVERIAVRLMAVVRVIPDFRPDRCSCRSLVLQAGGDVVVAGAASRGGVVVPLKS